MPTLVVHVRLHDGRYHGEGDWPPSPARLFQALVAGAGLGGPLGDPVKEALRWLECRKPPLIAAPLARQPRRGVRFFMPNNDSDAIGGDPRKLAKIRTATKVFRPYFFDAAVPFVYAWSFSAAEDDGDRARTICSLSERLYQLGRGIDMAWAWGEILEDREFENLLARHPGRVFRPSAGRSSTTLPCPCRGSIESIERRYRAYGERFRYVKDGGAVKVEFCNPPRPRFRPIPYDSPSSRQLYDLRDPDGDRAFAPWPLERTSALVVGLRDSAVKRLGNALRARKAEIERVLVGRKPDGTNDGPTDERVRIIPLPSIGHVHADREIRRVLVDVPPTCPLRSDDVHWAFSGLDVVDRQRGGIVAVLTPADDKRFLRHYGLGDDGRYLVWHTVTPAALPARRRGKTGSARLSTEAHAIKAVRTALRHAGVRARPVRIRVQREPFDRNSHMASDYEPNRFDARQLWHVEIVFDTLVSGPLVIGNGRYLGLGLMAPRPSSDAYVLPLAGEGVPKQHGRAFVEAARRAMIATASHLFDGSVEPFFHGHEENLDPLRLGYHAHLFLSPECAGDRVRALHLIAPWLADRAAELAIPETVKHRLAQRLEQVAAALSGIRVYGPGFPDVVFSGCLPPVKGDGMFASSRVWVSTTPYWSTRHPRKTRDPDIDAFLREDVLLECERRGWPRPKITVTKVERRNARLVGELRLEFCTAQPGPLIIGWNSHRGSGTFAPPTGQRTCENSD